MKKVMIIVFLFVFAPFVGAATIEEETAIQVANIENFGDIANNKIEGLANWINTYKADFATILDYDLINDLNASIQADKYPEMIALIVTALNESNNTAAATSLNNLKVGEFLDDYFALKEETLNFLNDNSAEMNITIGSIEGIDCLWDIVDAINGSYDNVKPKYTVFLNNLANLFGDVVTYRLNKYEKLTNTELTQVIETYDSLGTIISELITKFYDSLGEYGLIFDGLLGEDDIFMNKFKTKLRTDGKALIDACETKLQTPLNTFITKRWSTLRSDIDDLINGSSTTLNKNAYIYKKIDDINSVNERLDTKLKAIMKKIDSSAVKSFIQNILSRANTEFEDAAEYLENHLIVENYDIKLITDQVKEIFINRATEIVILDTVMPATVFKNNIMLSNPGMGLLDFRLPNEERVGTKSAIAVLDEGMAIKKQYLIVAKGDVDGNASITITDAIEAAYSSLGANELDRYEKIAADLDNNNNITITDAWEIARRALMQGGNL